MSARAEQAPSGYAAVGTMSERMGSDELIAVFSEGDGYASRALVDDVELAYECADDATFEHMVFRDCLFEQVDFRDCTFRASASRAAASLAAPWTRHGSTALTYEIAPRWG